MLRTCRDSRDLLLAGLVLGFACSLAMAADRPAVDTMVKDLSSDKEVLKVAAADALAVMGTDAAPAVPALGKALSDSSPLVRAHAARALSQIGEPAKAAAPALAKAVVDPDGKVRRAALAALRRLKPDREVTLPIISQALADADPGVRMHALQSIADLGEAAVPALMKALEHPEGKYWALLVISEIGPKAKDTVPQVTKLLADASPMTRREAVMALGSIGKDAESSLPEVIKLLHDKEMSVRFAAGFSIAALGPIAKSAVPALEANLSGNDEFMKVVSAWALAKVKNKDAKSLDQAVEILTQAVTSKDVAVRRAAIRGLIDLKPGPARVLPVLTKAFEMADPASVNEALNALAEVGEPAIPGLILALKIPAGRGHAAAILGRMGPKGVQAVDALAAALIDPHPEVRREICFALGAIGPDAASATPALVKLIEDEEQDDDHAVEYALGRIGPGAKQAIPALKKQLAGQNKFARGVAAWSLAHIAGKDPTIAAEIVPVLTEGLQNDQAKVRGACAEALGQLGPAAASATDALSALAKDPAESVQTAAKEAVRKITGK